MKGNLFAALSNVRPSHLLDPKLREDLGLDVAESVADSRAEALEALG